jgi:S-DNA-T family DNA segregation ATPase FtsK/SpoIIIE
MRPYQMRRHARRMRRYGLQPMVVINSGDRLPDFVVVLVCRALWRYRSELGPFVLAAATAFAALVLHLMRPHWWPWVLAVTVVAAGLLLWFGRLIGLAWRGERIYAATVTLAAGAWLATGIAISPTHPPSRACWVSAGWPWLFRGGRIAGGVPASRWNALWRRGRRSPKRSGWPDQGSCPP